jgi:AraC-like DNA-binding protein
MLAKEVGMNDYKLKIAFRQLFGMGLFEYHLGLRMNEARRLLEETNKPVKAIAKLTGYSRITSFITTFRKFFGYTPSSVRKRR